MLNPLYQLNHKIFSINFWRTRTIVSYYILQSQPMSTVNAFIVKMLEIWFFLLHIFRTFPEEARVVVVIRGGGG